MTKEFAVKFLNRLKENLKELKPGSIEEEWCKRKALITEISKMLEALP